MRFCFSILSFMVIVFSFTSCGGIKEVFSKDYIYEQVLENTKKAEIFESFETKASITATYLNPFELDINKTKENFLVSLFIADDFKKTYALKSPFVKITLNQKQAKEIRELKKDSPLLKTINILNPWAKYFLVTFKNDNNKEMNLTITYKKSTTTMNFTK